MDLIKVKWVKLIYGFARIAKIIKAISRAVKLSAILILALLTCAGVFWSSSAIIPIVACIGGVFAFFGLLIEDEAAKDEKRQTPEIFVADVSIAKAKGRFGWWILMIGIAIEMGVAFATALDDENTRQIAIQNSPLKRPVSEVFAMLRIVVSATNYDVNTPIQFNSSSLWFGPFNMKMEEAPIYFPHINNYLTRHAEFYESVMRFDQNTLPWGVWMNIDSTNPDISSPPSITLTDAMSQITSFTGYIDFIPKSAEFIKGSLLISMNGYQKTIRFNSDCISTQMAKWNPDKGGIFLSDFNFGTNATPWLAPND
jgi:hypothetical protein